MNKKLFILINFTIFTLISVINSAEINFDKQFTLMQIYIKNSQTKKNKRKLLDNFLKEVKYYQNFEIIHSNITVDPIIKFDQPLTEEDIKIFLQKISNFLIMICSEKQTYGQNCLIIDVNQFIT